MEQIQTSAAVNAPVSVIAPHLQNLKDILMEEREHLSTGKMDRLESFARKKMQALAQINMFVSNDSSHELAKANEEELRAIDGLLRENMKKLNFRIAAIGEITETIRTAVKDAESDGTYQPGSFFIRKRK